MNARAKWAARFTHAPRQNFTYLTVDQLIQQYPQYTSKRDFWTQVAHQRDRLCSVCGQFNVWKLVMDKMPKNDMCFTCITGETDASEDYEIIPDGQVGLS